MDLRKRASGAALLFVASLMVLAHAPESLSGEPSPVPAFDLNHMDRSADPCGDFYQFACGNWMKNNPIPPDRGSYGRGRELQEYNLTVLRGILEKASLPDPGHSQAVQKIGDLYASCMDEKGPTPEACHLSSPSWTGLPL